MAFDQVQRNHLQRLVADARDLLVKEFTRQLQAVYGIDPVSGKESALNSLMGLGDAELETARLLRETIAHYRAGSHSGLPAEAIDRVIREQAFTVLNRLCALRMAEARGLLVECVAKGPRSSGFQMYARLAGGALGEQMETYRLYLFGIFDELSLDLAVLFDRHSPLGRLFPRGEVLDRLLSLLSNEELASFWSEDETIGWIYQYFNSKEERKKMRDESAAPRNSRELAVRNQFFTPRYVVEFLTDNTLGRIWYEMRKGDTSLSKGCRYLVCRPMEIFLSERESELWAAEPSVDLSQEDLLKQPHYIEHRPAKDPRDIRVLDPACGSGHFLLYAFDLFERIYEEGWELEKGPKSELTGRSLREDYPSLEILRLFIPKLIVEHNLHGIDIDPRCTQIAGLSLWLRAQKSWQGLKFAERPGIRKSNIVCAEPMPGERDLLQTFVEREFRPVERTIFLHLLDDIWEKMQLAGEMGSLLKIEKEISGTIDVAKKAWLELQAKPAELFSVSNLNATRPQKEIDFLADIDLLEIGFFENFEQRVYSALRRFAEESGRAEGYKKRLFAEDTERGFAFIDVCSRKYHAIFMNPPFGLPAINSKSYLSQSYPDNWKDLYAAFVERVVSLSAANCYISAITPNMWLYTREMRAFRTSFLSTGSPMILAEIGQNVMDDAMVEAVIWVGKTGVSLSPMLSVDMMEVPVEKRAEALLFGQTHWKLRLPSSFNKIEGNPYCYHLEPHILNLWQSKERLEPDVVQVVAGNTTFSDFRYLRLWSEVPQEIGVEWATYRSGGDFQPYYSTSYLAIDWRHDGASMRELGRSSHGSDAQVMQSSRFWYREGLAYPRIGTIGVGVRAAQSGEIFSSGSVFISPMDKNIRFTLLGMLNSSVVSLLLTAHGRHRRTETLAFKDLPIGSKIIALLSSQVNPLVERAIAEIQKWEADDELSRLFSGCFLSGNWETWTRKEQETPRKVLDISIEISAIIAPIFHLSIEDLPPPDSVGWHITTTRIELARRIVSYELGAAFTRWDLRYAIGEKPVPPPPDPFAALPTCPPGMLQNAKGLPARTEDILADYPLNNLPWDGILVDDPGHPRDIEARVREVIDVIWKDRADAIEREACQILGVKSLRDYFRKPNLFFADHLKRYSKSRRQAPIYWPLSSASGNYTLWIYYHRLSDQTLYTCVNNFVDPKIQEVERHILALKADKKNTALAEAQDFLTELEDFKRELLEWAPKWKPNLNDGVLITASPLYKLFRLPKWRKDLESCWKTLERGDYEWAHLALSLWTERVRKVCMMDKSIAIAHGLEGLYVEPVGAMKRRRAKKVVKEPELGEGEE